MDALNVNLCVGNYLLLIAIQLHVINTLSILIFEINCINSHIELHIVKQSKLMLNICCGFIK